MKTGNPVMYPRKLLFLLAATLLLFLHGSGTAQGAEKYPNTEAGAKALLSEFLKPGADLKALSKQLQPTKADYETVFDASLAQKLYDLYQPAWEAGVLVIAPKAGQTELLLQNVPSSEIRQWSERAAAILPGGYRQISANIKDGYTIYTFKFVKPGEQLGMAFDGLSFVNGHWCIFPKPWRAAAKS
jgi:hypothetical protein